MVTPAKSERTARFPRARLPFVLLPIQVIGPDVEALGPLDSPLVAVLLFLMCLVHVQSRVD